MYVRYPGAGLSSNCFSIKDKHRTLLRMQDQERPALHVEVTVNDFDGYKVNFGDYKIGDAPLLIVNSLTKDPITFCQKDDMYVFRLFHHRVDVVFFDQTIANVTTAVLCLLYLDGPIQTARIGPFVQWQQCNHSAERESIGPLGC